ncbi:MAG: manganese efflux pump [Bacilli bacterium]|nr:manganese efflux pump [Bacilli bacterium]
MLSIFLIGLALSMDAFSLALSIGINKIRNIDKIKISIIIGIMHFIMPLLGVIIGTNIIYNLNINPDIFVILILLIVGILILFEKKEDKKILTYNIFTIFILALGVSFDSFSIGLGLIAITNNILLSIITFALCSGIISFGGLFIGELCANKFENKAPYIAAFILFTLAIVKIMEYFSLIN